ncbi:MAG: hypothetical protein M0P12_03190 [Paludibacteraceae bacterium]|nr:hypothetical protein [Paludibacteraceae bacterium]
MVKVKDLSELKDGQRIRFVTNINHSEKYGDLMSPVHVVRIVDGIVCGVNKVWKTVMVLSECQSVYRI